MTMNNVMRILILVVVLVLILTVWVVRQYVYDADQTAQVVSDTIEVDTIDLAQIRAAGMPAIVNLSSDG